MKNKAKMSSLSQTHIKDKARRKTNPTLADAIKNARKNKSWVKLAHVLSGASRKHASINLEQIDKQTKAGDTILVPGKILGSGDITKKIKICALGISASALSKLKASKSEFITIGEEIKSNAKAEGIKVIQGC